MLICLILYFVVINLITFVVYGVDKKKAIRHRHRISERTLISLAVIGGSVGAFLGMMYFHHKTLHPQFKIGIPVIFTVQLLIVIIIFRM